MHKYLAIICLLFCYGIANAESGRSEKEKIEAFKRCDDVAFTAFSVGRFVYMEKKSGAPRQSNAIQNGKVDLLIQEVERQAYLEIDSQEKWNHFNFAARRLFACGNDEKLNFGKIADMERCFIGSEAIYWLIDSKEDGKTIDEAIKKVLKRMPNRKLVSEDFVNNYSQRVFQNNYEQNNKLMRGFFYTCIDGS